MQNAKPAMPQSHNAASEIRRLLDADDVEGAKTLCRQIPQWESDPRLCYLYGRACARQGAYHEALTAFSRAAKADPQSPAHEAMRMMHDIFAFRNTDMINP